MILKHRISYTALLYVFIVFVTGCTMFRYSIIPQEQTGPHGGALAFVDQRVPEYIEFVAMPKEKEWTFQVFVYDKNLKQRDICGSGYLTVVLPDGTKKGLDLWNTKPYFWSKGKGYLENKMKLDNPREFVVNVSIFKGRRTERLTFEYPYNQKGKKENEKD